MSAVMFHGQRSASSAPSSTVPVGAVTEQSAPAVQLSLQLAPV